MIINSPLKVPKTKDPTKAKKAKQFFILNLNNYRNTHFLVLNNTKKNYKVIIQNQIDKLPVYPGQITLHYKLFPGSKRRTDIGNVVSIHKKYFEDALAESGHIKDDDYTIVIGSSESFGRVDKENPRVEITITEIKD